LLSNALHHVYARVSCLVDLLLVTIYSHTHHGLVLIGLRLLFLDDHGATLVCSVLRRWHRFIAYQRVLAQGQHLTRLFLSVRSLRHSLLVLLDLLAGVKRG